MAINEPPTCIGRYAHHGAYTPATRSPIIGLGLSRLGICRRPGTTQDLSYSILAEMQTHRVFVETSDLPDCILHLHCVIIIITVPVYDVPEFAWVDCFKDPYVERE